MVKIPGRFSSPADRNFVPGATYVGDSRLIGLGIFLDQSDSSDVLLRFDNQKPVFVSFKEFSRIVEYFEQFSTGLANNEMTEPNPMRVSAVLLESSRVHLRWNNSSSVLFPLQFFQVLNILISARSRLETMIRKKKEKHAALREGGFILYMRTWGSLTIYLLLSIFDLILFTGLLFQRSWFSQWLILTLFLGVWMIFFRPDWSTKIGPALNEYLNSSFLSDLIFLNFKRKAAGIFIIVLTCLAVYALLSGGIVEFIINYYRRKAQP